MDRSRRGGGGLIRRGYTWGAVRGAKGAPWPVPPLPPTRRRRSPLPVILLILVVLLIGATIWLSMRGYRGADAAYRAGRHQCRAGGLKLALAAGAAALSLAIPAFGQQAPASRTGRNPCCPKASVIRRRRRRAVRRRNPARRPLRPANILPSTPAAPSSGVPAGRRGRAGRASARSNWRRSKASLPKPIEIPDFARRPVEVVGPLTRRGWRGLGMDAWGNANGRFLSTLMRRTMRRCRRAGPRSCCAAPLLSRVPAPRSVNRSTGSPSAHGLTAPPDGRGGRGADAWCSRSMSIGSRRRCSRSRCKPGLATADPAALCPLVAEGQETSNEPGLANCPRRCAPGCAAIRRRPAP